MSESGEEFAFTEESLQKAADTLAKALKSHIRDRLDKRGRTLPKGVDLRDTDRLINSIKGEVIEGLACAITDVPYAVYLEQRYQFFGIKIPSQQWEKFLKKVQKVLEEGAYFVSTGPRKK